MNILKAFFFTFISTILYLGPTEISTQDVNNSSILVCSGADNCETCVRDTACFWCETKLLCKVYSAGNEEAQNKQCGEWKWKSCNEVIEAPTAVIISAATVSAGLIFVFLVFICIKRDIWNSLKNSQFCDRWDRSDREGLFEQEERLKRKRKHRKSQSSKAQKFAEKYQLNDSEILLYQSP
ncbi:unnamed protein product [Porites evermanni]|uniref:PTTG1 interacting protein n=1 Tax=Porites evermanni TaxID=104178 RepID=A0ABN8LXD0_9CNID|nr:unnamed protein product [Porites evermanni]